jgi:hypothetical protein
MPAGSGLRVGLGDQIVNSRYSPAALARANYLTAMASGGVIIFEVTGAHATAARFYLEPVETASSDANTAVRTILGE